MDIIVAFGQAFSSSGKKQSSEAFSDPEMILSATTALSMLVLFLISVGVECCLEKDFDRLIPKNHKKRRPNPAYDLGLMPIVFSADPLETKPRISPSILSSAHTEKTLGFR
jgi:hypothetical protein